MATREARLAQFSQGVPKENRPLEILCEDQAVFSYFRIPASGQKARGGKLEALNTLKQP